MTAATYKLRLVRGKTCEQVLLYADTRLRYLPIEAMPSQAPVRLTLTAHAIPDNWPVRVQGVTAPAELNTKAGMAVRATVVDADTVELNSLDATTWAAFVASGHLVFQAPVDLTGWKARMHIRDKVGGNLLMSLSSDPADEADGEIQVDVVNSAFVIKLSAAQTAGLPWNSGVYDLEAIRPDGAVVGVLAPSPVIVEQEVTVWA